MIITISRETGSGGHTIGQMLAQRLGYDFYDEEIISEIARSMHLEEAVVSESGEYMDDRTFIDMASGYVPFSRRKRVPYEEIKQQQDALIGRLAGKGNCVIVGRGADAILADRADSFHVFIHADMPHRIERVQRHEGITGQEKRIERELEVKDRSRGMFYQYFTGREWGSVRNYHLTVDSGRFSKTQCVDLILAALNMLREGTENA